MTTILIVIVCTKIINVHNMKPLDYAIIVLFAIYAILTGIESVKNIKRKGR